MQLAHLLTAIREEPEVLLHRLVCADWFEENGLPERAEFIRIQISLSQGVRDRGTAVELMRRMRELFVRYRTEWLGALHNANPLALFEQGFVTHLCIDAKEYLANAATILAQHPIHHLRLTGVSGCVQQLAADPMLALVPHVNLQGNYLGAESLLPLAESTASRSLRCLDLSGTRLTGVGLQELASDPWPSLHTLILASNPLTGMDLQSSLRSERFPNLERLDVSHNDLSGRHSTLFARHLDLPSLRVLRLAGTGLSYHDIRRIVNAARFPRLTLLDVSGCVELDQQCLALRRRFSGQLVC